MYVSMVVFFFFFKQKTAYEMRISDWSSDVCSSDLAIVTVVVEPRRRNLERPAGLGAERHIGGGRFAGALRHVASGRAGGEGGQGEQGRISKHRSSPRLVMLNLLDRKSTRLNSSH